MSSVNVMKAELEKAQTLILKTSRIDRDQLSEMMFRLGLRFARQFSKRFLSKDTVYYSLTHEKRFGFWDWWRLKWALDDNALVNTGTYTQEDHTYEELKECMIGDELLEDQLFHKTEHLI